MKEISDRTFTGCLVIEEGAFAAMFEEEGDKGGGCGGLRIKNKKNV